MRNMKKNSKKRTTVSIFNGLYNDKIIINECSIFNMCTTRVRAICGPDGRKLKPINYKNIKKTSFLMFPGIILCTKNEHELCIEQIPTAMFETDGEYPIIPVIKSNILFTCDIDIVKNNLEIIIPEKFKEIVTSVINTTSVTDKPIFAQTDFITLKETKNFILPDSEF